MPALNSSITPPATPTTAGEKIDLDRDLRGEPLLRPSGWYSTLNDALSIGCFSVS